MTNSAALDARGLVRRYADRTVVDHVSLTILAGESVSLMGTSGCGKTTLLHILGTLDRPDEGQLLIGGQDRATLGERKRARLRRETLGFVFQQSNLLPSLSALENVALPASRVSGRRAEAMDRAAALFVAFRTGGARPSQGPHPFSRRGTAGGGSASAHRRSRVVLADEPSGSLDSGSTDAVLRRADGGLSLGAALLVVTHDPQVAARCARQLVMHDGRLLQPESVSPPARAHA